MTEQLENTAALPAPAKTPGRGPAMLALLLALIALGLAVFLGYRLVYLQPFAAQAEQAEQLVAAAEQRLLAELDTGLSDSRADIAALAQSLREENFNLQQQLQADVAQNLADMTANKPTTPRQWRLAEAQFLMRVANHWLLLEGDVATALKALQAADQVLLALQGNSSGGEYDLLPVRLLLAQEILALQQFTPIDVLGIYAQLQALGAALPEVRGNLALSALPAASAESADAGWAAVVAQLSQFVRITDLSKNDLSENNETSASWDNGSLGPAQLIAARRQAIAAIERAQVAVLRSQESLYQSSLEQAKQAVLKLELAPNAEVRAFLTKLEQLADQRLQQPLPNISGSLQALGRAVDES